MYSLEQIKAAFWKTFHGQGELWFPYTDLASEEEAQNATESYWNSFVEALEGDQPKC